MMTNEELLAISVLSIFCMPFVSSKYKTNEQYKAIIDWNLLSGYKTMAMLYLRDKGMDADNILTGHKEEIKTIEDELDLARNIYIAKNLFI